MYVAIDKHLEKIATTVLLDKDDFFHDQECNDKGFVIVTK